LNATFEKAAAVVCHIGIMLVHARNAFG